MVLEDVGHPRDRVVTEVPSSPQLIGPLLDTIQRSDRHRIRRDVRFAVLRDEALEPRAVLQHPSDEVLDPLLFLLPELRLLPEREHLDLNLRRSVQLQRLDLEGACKRCQHAQRRLRLPAFVLGERLLGDDPAHRRRERLEREASREPELAKPHRQHVAGGFVSWHGRILWLTKVDHCSAFVNHAFVCGCEGHVPLRKANPRPRTPWPGRTAGWYRGTDDCRELALAAGRERQCSLDSRKALSQLEELEVVGDVVYP